MFSYKIGIDSQQNNPSPMLESLHKVLRAPTQVDENETRFFSLAR